MMQYIVQNILAVYIGGTLRFLYHRVICRDKNVSYNRILHGIPNAKTKKQDTFNIKNEMKNRLVTVVFLVILILLGILFKIIP